MSFPLKNTPAIRRPTTFPCSATYLPRHCIYSSSAGSVARPAVPPSSWENAELNSTGINEALAPAPDFPGSRFLAFSFPLARHLEEDSSSVFPSIISPVPSLQIRVSTEQKAPSCSSWFQGTASGKAYPPSGNLFYKNPPTGTAPKPTRKNTTIRPLPRIFRIKTSPSSSRTPGKGCVPTTFSLYGNHTAMQIDQQNADNKKRRPPFRRTAFKILRRLG